MPDSNEMLARQNAALTRQLLEWLACGEHRRTEVIDVWHSTCPRHTIWEDALAAGFVVHDGSHDGVVGLSPKGLSLLRTAPA